ncbi:hypothetical protein PsYK624_101100 [Phanerochaete sordida]|uniref:Uncharacterized protein n=1 Tax=Phanerochaete sordida TaxID=48140 RepID=A0A9P3GHU6_9APHY|nr:hypothetical protein PsYK624_101100 [Phanerochaete sordida]
MARSPRVLLPPSTTACRTPHTQQHWQASPPWRLLPVNRTASSGSSNTAIEHATDSSSVPPSSGFPRSSSLTTAYRRGLRCVPTARTRRAHRPTG